MTTERWPTVYDFKELQTQISEIAKCNYSRGFYSLCEKNELCQGDIIYIKKKFLYIDENGEYSAEEYTNYWMIVGNTCDIARSIPVEHLQCLGLLLHFLSKVSKNAGKNKMSISNLAI